MRTTTLNFPFAGMKTSPRIMRNSDKCQDCGRSYSHREARVWVALDDGTFRCWPCDVERVDSRQQVRP